jgi:hypothetical protein
MSDGFSEDMKSIETKMKDYNGSDTSIDQRKPYQKRVIMEIIKGPLFSELNNRCNIDNYNNDGTDIEDTFANFVDEITGSNISTYINNNGVIETQIKDLANTYSPKLQTLVKYIFTQNICPGILFKSLLKFYSINNGLNFKINYEKAQQPGQSGQGKNKGKGPNPNANKQAPPAATATATTAATTATATGQNGGGGKRKNATKKQKRANKRRKTIKKRKQNVVVL